MAMPAVSDLLQDILKVVDLGHAGTSKKAIRNAIRGESSLPDIELEFAAPP